jgi:hypothetical protein
MIISLVSLVPLVLTCKQTMPIKTTSKIYLWSMTKLITKKWLLLMLKWITIVKGKWTTNQTLKSPWINKSFWKLSDRYWSINKVINKIRKLLDLLFRITNKFNNWLMPWKLQEMSSRTNNLILLMMVQIKHLIVYDDLFLQILI